MQKRPVYKILPLDPGFGFYNLPEPTSWDIYLDLEGDPMVESGGREYIFGWWYQGQYNIIWAEDANQEKLAFETFIDFVKNTHKAHPDLHIYHFGAYEVSAFKRLMCKYATRENEMDDFLRNSTFIDLHRIVKQSLMAGVEKYSLKDLEKYHGYTREMDLRTLSGVKAEYELLLETNRLNEVTDEMREVIRVYNMDDCISTAHLHQWLERLRQEQIDAGQDIARPLFEYTPPPQDLSDFFQLIQPIYERLMFGLPLEQKDRTPAEQAKFILANSLAYYRREDKSFWWEFFRIIGLTEDELLEEKNALSGLFFTGEREFVNLILILFLHKNVN
ncbi:MAG: TM0106 family RecB-like putative nuclease [Sphingobacteriales bacterium]|nr:TM0106 family RecB-like putative nuclease [Sphingobacteriales bacterium]